MNITCSRKKQDHGATDYQKRAHLLANALDEVLAKIARRVRLRRSGTSFFFSTFSSYVPLLSFLFCSFFRCSAASPARKKLLSVPNSNVVLVPTL